MNSTTLLIMRHAKSDWNLGGKDFDRVLAERGRRDALRMGQWLVNNHYTPEKILCSPAKRVEETISLVGRAWKLDNADIIWNKSIYNAEISNLLEVIANNLSANKTNLLTGHNPGVSDLLLHLSGNHIPKTATDNLMPTNAIAVMECHDKASFTKHGAWKIIDYMKPKLLA